MDRTQKIPVAYTAFSKHCFYAKMQISSYVLDRDYLPLNPFTNWGYFMDDMVERDRVVRANNNLVRIADELWQFGPIADGCLAEIKLARKLGKKVRFFSVGKKLKDIRELNVEDLGLRKRCFMCG